MPSTRAPASSSGPPELPGLIEASVWIAPSIWNLVSDSTERSVAETTPTESDCCSPKGLPIAATGWPTSSSRSSPSFSGCSVEAVGLRPPAGPRRRRGRSRLCGRGRRCGRGTRRRLPWRACAAPPDSSVTTWALVTMLAAGVEDEARALGGAAAEDRADRDHAGRGLAVDPAPRRSRRAAASTITCGVCCPPPSAVCGEEPPPPEPPQPASASASASRRGGPAGARALTPPALEGRPGAGCAVPARDRGRSSVKAVKRLLEAIATRPCIRCAISRAIARPSPDPPAESAV